MECLLVDISGAFLGVGLIAEFAFERTNVHVESHVLLHCLIIRVSLEADRALCLLHLLFIPFSRNPFGELFNKIRAQRFAFLKKLLQSHEIELTQITPDLNKPTLVIVQHRIRIPTILSKV